jgi:2-(1,2-epoxy-1,2-dihydrophenyl)acetyl-CoA isomerase
MKYEKITYEQIADVAVVRLDDAKTLNAVSGQLGAELIDAVRRSQAGSRALLIGSTGRAFSSGANLRGGINLDDPTRDAGASLETTFNPLIMQIRESAIPIVTAVRGAAAGFGCSLALCADIILASENAFFYQAFRHVGLVPDGGAAYLLSRSIGRVRAMQMMLLGEKLPADKALEWGLVTRVVPDGELDAAALATAEELGRGPRSLGMIRRSAWFALDADLPEQLRQERGLQRDASRTADFVEGVKAFREKRNASFKGN